MQLRLRDLACASAAAGQALPLAYHRLFRLWFACGIPAFAAVLAIIWLMLARPPLWWAFDFRRGYGQSGIAWACSSMVRADRS